MSDLPVDELSTPGDIGEASVDVPEATNLDTALESGFLESDSALGDITAVQDTQVANFAESELTTSQDVADYVENSIPPEHLADLKSIEYVDSGEMQEKGYLGVWTHDYYSGANNIEIYPHQDAGELYDSIAHEVGHNAGEVVSPQAMGQWNDIYQQSMHAYNESNGAIDPFVTNYAHESASEDFAESYAMYINDPPLLKGVSPEKYDFMVNNVFNGKEF